MAETCSLGQADGKACVTWAFKPQPDRAANDGSTVCSTQERRVQHPLPTAGEPRKILLDCGANVASTVQLFRETYPGGKDFIIHSFEIDERLAPYFAPYPNHVLHCPTGVSNKDGNMTAYLESVWSPDKDSEYQWGGGTLFAGESEKANTETGGRRKLTLHRTVPTVDLSRWIQENTAVEDYVIFKLDVEGAEYDILKKMLADGTFKWVDR
ncbi:hypothetical protein Bbelb_364560 [Branchiostoma belcheri]|nr:hypothetical protein Bbelb_364560 [Branchiostoma belcheri]